MRIIRQKTKPQSASHSSSISTDTYFFCEKRTGVAHLRVEADAAGQLPIEQAAGLLAMHCLVRGHSPDDYVVMVKASKDLLGGVLEKSKTLLRVGRSVPAPVPLSRREDEVLNGIMRSMANKEIAAALNLSERTVKFHVSSLLAKFRVRGRMELAREASRACLTSRLAPNAELTPFPAFHREVAARSLPPADYRRADRGSAVLPLPKRQMTA